MKKHIIFLALNLISIAALIGQVQFQKTYGTPNNDEGYQALQVDDTTITNGEILVVGYTNYSGINKLSAFRVNSNGVLIGGTSTGGGSTHSYGRCITKTPTNIFIAGYKNNTSTNNDIYLRKMNPYMSGLVWEKLIGGVGNDYVYSMKQTSDGGLILVGKSDSFWSGGDDVYLIKVDVNGNITWTKTYGETTNEIGWDVEQTNDGGYIIVGQSDGIGAGGNDVLLIKTTSTGVKSWVKTYGGTGQDVGSSVQQTSDNGFIITGSTNSFSSGDYEVYLIKTDIMGDTLWTKRYGSTLGTTAASVKQTSDGGYIITGNIIRNWSFLQDVYLIRTNSIGDTIWTKAYGGNSADMGYNVQIAKDNGYIISGKTESFGVGGRDYYLIKTDEFGNSGGCNEYSTSTIVNNTNTVYGSLAMLSVGFGGSVSTTSNNSFGYTISEDTVCTNCDLTISRMITNVSCYNDSNGSIDISISGGLPPYSYSWSNGSTSEDIYNLQAASYLINVVDSNGCTNKSIATVTEPSQLSVIINSTDASIGNCDGTATGIVNGGTPPYFYQWDDPLNQNTSFADSLCQGTIILSITDSNGCVITDSVIINENPLTVNQFKTNNNFNIYPNPSTGIFTFEINKKLNNKIEISITDILGKIIKNEKTIIYSENSNIIIDLSNEPKGIYLLKIKENQNDFILKLLKQ